MFAVFNKGKFVNWWHNSASDLKWVERTAIGMGWEINDVVVRDFSVRPAIDDIHRFNEDGSIELFEKVQMPMEAPGGDGIVNVEVLREKGEIEGEVYFSDGAYAVPQVS